MLRLKLLYKSIASSFCRTKIVYHKPSAAAHQMPLLNPGSRLTDVVKQSPNDKRQYRVIVLENGLRALLISDVDADADKSSSTSSAAHPANAANSQHNRLHGHGHTPSKSRMTEKENYSGSEDDESESDGGNTDSDSDISEMDVDVEPHPRSRANSKASTRGRPSSRVLKEDDDAEKLAAAALCVGVGSFSDPEEVPGLAHFLEHMVFMGSMKYPDENAFDSFIKKHGGSDNAFTDCERTVFYFDVERKHFKEALDIFAQFFISPLMKTDSVDREIKAVESEFAMSKTSDTARKQQLLGFLAKKGHPMGKFMWGNEDSLKNMPESQGVDLYTHLQTFHDKYYSAHIMTLAVQAKESLDDLEAWVKEIFSEVPRNGIEPPKFDHIQRSFHTEAFTKMYEIVPVKNQHSVELTWHLPCMKHLYRSKPLHYVGWLTGHEGKGSILSCLRKNLWALGIGSGNSESGWDHNTCGAMFTVHITLTDKGLAQLYKVMTVVFEYIEMLRRHGAIRRIFDEIKIIEDNEFRWKEQVDPSEYVEHIAEAMQLYEPADYLCGDSLMFEYNSEAIEEVLSQLKPSNVNILVMSRNFDRPENNFHEEFWYKTKYTAKDIPEEYKKRWRSLEPRVDLHLPHQNDYVAKDFSIRPKLDDYSNEPKLVLNTPQTRLFFKQDKKFKVPRGYIYINILAPIISSNPRAQALFDLFVDVLSHNLQEVAYSAHVAQMEYEFKTNPTGLIMKISGFNDKLFKLVQTIVDNIAHCQVTEELIFTLNEQLKKKYYNSSIRPEKLARDLRLMILEERGWTKSHRYSFLEDVHKKDLEMFVSEFKRMNFIELYVHGNFSLEEAMEIESYIRTNLTNGVIPQTMLPVERVVELPRTDTVVRVKSFNIDDTNSCVCNYYQAGPCKLREFVTNELLNMMMDEPCFDILRTREQLGYSVYCSAKNTNGIIGICIVVGTQADNFSVQDVDEKIEEFLQEFKDRLNSCTTEEFDCQRKSLIAIKQCDDSHMGEEADRLWAEIRDCTYLFNRLDKEIDELEKLTLDEVKQWFHVILDGEDNTVYRRKLSVQVVGFGETETDVQVLSSSDNPSSLSSSLPVDMSLCQDLTSTSPKKSNNTDGFTPLSEAFALQYLEVNTASSGDAVNVVDNVIQYKHTLSLYPVSKVL